MEWIAYYKIEPFCKYADFIPVQKTKKRKPQTQEQMAAMLNLLT